MPTRSVAAALAALGLVVLATPAAPAHAGSRAAVGAPLAHQLAIAHRGMSYDAPEHTFFAYDLAMSADADMLECDLQLTKDGVLVCIHDTTVDRTTGGTRTGRVDAFTLAELREMDFGTWYNTRNPTRAKDEYAGARIVPFEEQLGCYLGHNPKARFHVETKAPSEYDGRMEPALVALLDRYGLLSTGQHDAETSTVVVQSFDLDSLRAVKALAPDLPTAFLFSAPPDQTYLDGTLPSYVDIAAPTSAFLLGDPAYVELAHAKGHPVHTWTVDDEQQIDALLDQGVDGIFSNRVDLVRAHIDARGTGVPEAARANPATFPALCPGWAGTVNAAAAEPVVPEAPVAALLPLAALAVVTGAAVALRSRKTCP